MTYQDLFITPIYLMLLYGIAYAIRPWVTDAITRPYFIPALSVKFLGAIMVGVIYQFYYGGGDTFTYFHLGSRFIWQAFLDSPDIAFSLIFGGNEYTPVNYDYASQIWTFRDPASFGVVRFAGLFDIFTLHTYSATSLFFAAFSFSGVWMLYLTFLRYFPAYPKGLAYCVLFLPSCFFWGSGILKDTLTLAAIGYVFYSISGIAERRGLMTINIFLLAVGFQILYIIKQYILICFFPAVLFWFFVNYQTKVKNLLIRIFIIPFLIAVGGSAAYYGLINLASESNRYSLDNILFTAEETARWIHYSSDLDGGSSYSFGDYDFSPTGLIRKFIPATFTTFFRPFLWEVRNPVMLLAALENTVLLLLFIATLRNWRNYKFIVSNPVLLLCLVFAIIFGFAIGVSTYNFGSLVRYKIPILPFLFTSFYILSRRHPDLKKAIN